MQNFTALMIGAAMFVSAPAYAADYTTDTVTYTSVGDQIGSAYDQVTLGGVTGTFTTPGAFALNTISFVAGINANRSGAVTSGAFANRITIGSNTYTYSVPYTIMIDTFDTLTFTTGSASFGNYTLNYNPLLLRADARVPARGVLTANVVAAAVPETATWAMMLAGFGMIGFVTRRRSPVRTTVTHA